MNRYGAYGLPQLRRDLVAGLIVGVVAIPLGMAFAIASGVKPEYGIYTTIIAGILVSLLGGSVFQIGGPTGAFVPVLLGIVTVYGYQSLLVAGFMAGIILVLMGLLKCGALIRFIPRPVTIGFTSGIAVTIFSGQIANFFGLQDLPKHEDFLSNMVEIGKHLGGVSYFSVATAGICLAVLILLPRLNRKIPASIVGLLAATLAASFFFPGQTETIGTAYGSIPAKLPHLQIPTPSFADIRNLIGPAFVIAMLGAIESLLSAVVADGMGGTKHDSNRELIGQGVANLVVPLFGGIPATGAIARTATNIRSGAVSPMSGIIHGVVVLAVLLLFAPYASDIPLAAMAPILMVVAWNMSERKEFVRLLKTKTGDSLILAITFLLTVFTDLTTAVEVGLIAAVIIFVKQMSEALTVAKVLPDPNHEGGKVGTAPVAGGHHCPQISLFTVEGPLFFGASKALEEFTAKLDESPARVVVLRMNRVPLMDTTGAHRMEELVHGILARGDRILVSGIRSQPKGMLLKTGLWQAIGEENFFERTGHALRYAFYSIDTGQCQSCRRFIFRECPELCGEQESGQAASFRDIRKEILPEAKAVRGR